MKKFRSIGDFIPKGEDFDLPKLHEYWGKDGESKASKAGILHNAEVKKGKAEYGKYAILEISTHGTGTPKKYRTNSKIVIGQIESLNAAEDTDKYPCNFLGGNICSEDGNWYHTLVYNENDNDEDK